MGKKMMKGECGMMNKKRLALSFIIPRSSSPYILSNLSILVNSFPSQSHADRFTKPLCTESA